MLSALEQILIDYLCPLMGLMSVIFSVSLTFLEGWKEGSIGCFYFFGDICAVVWLTCSVTVQPDFEGRFADVFTRVEKTMKNHCQMRFDLIGALQKLLMRPIAVRIRARRRDAIHHFP